MTQRYGINRQTDNSITSSRHLNNQSAATAAKSADVENFNAAMRAKADVKKELKDNTTESEVKKHCELNNPGTQMAPGATTATVQVQAFAGMNKNTNANHVSFNPHTGTPSGGGNITLALALPSGATPAVQQATTIIHRIMQTTTGTKEPRVWNLQLTIDGKQQYTICVEYRGKTDWAIGLLDERNSSNNSFEEQANEQMEFTQELRNSLQMKNPSLQISSLRAGRYT